MRKHGNSGGELRPHPRPAGRDSTHNLLYERKARLRVIEQCGEQRVSQARRGEAFQCRSNSASARLGDPCRRLLVFTLQHVGEHGRDIRQRVFDDVGVLGSVDAVIGAVQPCLDVVFARLRQLAGVL